jgi:hypothetical protein
MMRTGFEGYVSARAGVKLIAAMKASDAALIDDVVGFMEIPGSGDTGDSIFRFVARSGWREDRQA